MGLLKCPEEEHSYNCFLCQLGNSERHDTWTWTQALYQSLYCSDLCVQHLITLYTDKSTLII